MIIFWLEYLVLVVLLWTCYFRVVSKIISSPDCFFVGVGVGNSLGVPGSTNGQTNGNKEGGGGGTDNEENGGVMNNIMSDIQNGFVHRRLPDGGFKVCQPNVSWVIDF